MQNATKVMFLIVFYNNSLRFGLIINIGPSGWLAYFLRKMSSAIIKVKVWVESEIVASHKLTEPLAVELGRVILGFDF